MKRFGLFLILTIILSSPAHAISTVITIENQSKSTINGARIVSTSPSKKKDQVHQKTLIYPGDKRSFDVETFKDGTVDTRVHYRFNGSDKMSQTHNWKIGKDTSESKTLIFLGTQPGLWKQFIRFQIPNSLPSISTIFFKGKCKKKGG